MDPEFRRMLLVVFAIGGVMGGVGAAVLYFVFRAYGGRKAGSSAHVGLIAALVSFVLACSVLLFALSYWGK
jgi:uncharacterized membrane protein YbhN (UPF0104 family)